MRTTREHIQRFGRVAVAAAAFLLFSRCGESTAPDRITQVTLTPTASTLLVGPGGGQSAQLVATATTSGGATRPAVSIIWASTAPAVATVSPAGLVTALQQGVTTISATVGTVVGSAQVTVAPVPVATVTITEDSVRLTRSPLTGAQSRQLIAQLRDSTGVLLIGRPVAWTSVAPSVASITISGLVTAVSTGVTRVIASSLDGRADTALVLVTTTDTLPDDADIAITAAVWTQGVQNAAGTIPLIPDGRAAVLNVLLSATRDIATPSVIVLRILDGAGNVVLSDTASVVVSSASPGGFAAPTVQFLVPASALQRGRRWEVVRDPRGVLADADAANDRQPRAGAALLALYDVPPLKIRLVPIVLTAHGNATGNVSSNNLDEYMRLVRALLPHGPLGISIGTPLASARSFGAAPTGGASLFWTGLLAEIDQARVADPTFADAHWIGVVLPPAGFNFSTFGGFGYIPSSGSSYGPATRTTALVSVGWFIRESATRELVAHELGHNFGRRHAPCGTASSPDPSFPNLGGTVGEFAHDVNAWALGLAGAAAPIPTAIGDIMGYCTPVWISAYSYSGMLAFRGPVTVALGSPGAAATSLPRRIRSLMVRGTVRSGVVAIEPALAIDVFATGEDAGDHIVEGRAQDGRVLFQRRFTLTALDHDATTQSFAVAVPMDDALMNAIESVVVRGPGGTASRDRSRRMLADPPAMRRTAAGLVFSCPSETAAIMVQESGSDRVLGSASGAEVLVQSGTLAAARVSCSDGIRTMSSVVRLR